jgi:spore coat polysaccharide biosynthesis protein SpsF (cytidylyltransferase family)
MSIIAIIGARLNSSRLPGKHLKPLAGVPMIKRLTDRLKRSEMIDQIVLATTADTYNEQLIEWADGHVSAYAHPGDVDDLIGRINQVVINTNATTVAYICGDCPLVDPGFVDHAIRALLSDPDADTVALAADVVSLHEGMHFYSRAGWDRLVAASRDAMEREHVGYADRDGAILNTKRIQDSDDFSLVEQRISVDTAADYQFMNRIYQLWFDTQPADSIVPLNWVQQQLAEHHRLGAINAHVVQKVPNRTYGSVTLFCHASPRVGLGHLRRCSLIADSLQEHFGLGAQVHVLGPPKALDWVPSNCTWHESLGVFEAAMKRDLAAAWILDFHPDHIATQKLAQHCQLKKARQPTAIVALDMCSPLVDVADLWFVPAFYNEQGPEFACYGWQNLILPPRIDLPNVRRVLVLTGGSDALGYGTSLPAIIEDAVPEDWPILWVQGPYAAPPSPLKSARWEIRKSPDNLSALIAESEVVLSCYGLSLIEALRSGSRTLLLPPKGIISDRELQAFIAEDCCLVATKTEQIPKLLDTCLDPKAMRHKTAKCLELLSEADGSKRLGERLITLMGDDPAA